MALKKLKPTTPGQRFKVASTFEEITASKPEKSLVFGISKSGGRNNQDNFVILSARNLSNVNITNPQSVNTYDILHANNVIFSETAIKEIESMYSKS